jgi:hypothetical protein
VVVPDEAMLLSTQQSMLLLEGENLELKQQLAVTRELAGFLQRCLDEPSHGAPLAASCLLFL